MTMRNSFAVLCFFAVLLTTPKIHATSFASPPTHDFFYAVYDQDTGQYVHLPQEARPVAFSPDGSRFVTLDHMRRTPTLWHWQNGTATPTPLELRPENDSFDVVRFLPDSSCIILGTTTHPVVKGPENPPACLAVFDGQTGRLLTTLTGPDDRAMRFELQFPPGGTDLIVGTWSPGQTRIVEILSVGPGVDIVSYRVETVRINYRTNKVLWRSTPGFRELSADGQRVLMEDDTHVFCADAETGKTLWQAPCMDAYFCETENLVLVTRFEETYRGLVFKKKDVKFFLATYRRDTGEKVLEVEGKLESISEDGSCRIVSVPGGKVLYVLKDGALLWQVQNPHGLSAKLQPAGRYCVIRNERGDGSLNLYEIATGRNVRSLSKDDIDYWHIFPNEPDRYRTKSGRLFDIETGKEILERIGWKTVPLPAVENEPWKLYSTENPRFTVLVSGRLKSPLVDSPNNFIRSEYAQDTLRD